MANDNRILAIDVGGDSLKMAEFTYTAAGGMVMDKFAYRRIDVPTDGVEEPPTFREIYNEMLVEYGFTASVNRGCGSLARVRLTLIIVLSVEMLEAQPPFQW